MTKTGKRKSERSTRGKSNSPGRPPVWQGEDLCRFWQVIPVRCLRLRRVFPVLLDSGGLGGLVECLSHIFHLRRWSCETPGTDRATPEDGRPRGSHHAYPPRGHLSGALYSRTGCLEAGTFGLSALWPRTAVTPLTRPWQTLPHRRADDERPAGRGW